MSDFMLFEIPDYNDADQSVSKTLWSRTSCICCLREKVKFVKLPNCEHIGVFQFKFKIEFENAVLCYQCHHFLKKIRLFKEQLEENLILLNEQPFNMRPTRNQFHNLKTSKTNTLDIIDNLKNESIESTSSVVTANITDYVDVIKNLKIEHDTYSDNDKEIIHNDICIHLTEIKEEEKVSRKKSSKEKKSGKSKKKSGRKKEERKKEKQSKRKRDVNEKNETKQVSVVKKKRIVKSKKQIFEEKYEGKIAVVCLTEDEMMLERDRDMKKETYLKFLYKCESCITGFDHELALQSHMKNRHSMREGCFVCAVCNSVLGSEPTFRLHMTRHTRRFECQECHMRFNNIYSTTKHYNENHGTLSTPYTCGECGFTTQSHRVLRHHRDKHKQKPQCPLCFKFFVNRGGVRNHLITVHRQSDRVFHCELCDKQYRTKNGLKSHVTSIHEGTGAYCDVCQKNFRTPYILAHHRRTHSNHISEDDKKFVCDECGARFVTKRPLQEHINFVHLKSQQNLCKECGRVFSNHRELKRHENYVHKKIRPPRNRICDYCGKGFFAEAILRAHLRTHTGERPLTCTQCPATFAHPSALYNHTKLVHRKRAPE